MGGLSSKFVPSPAENGVPSPPSSDNPGQQRENEDAVVPPTPPDEDVVNPPTSRHEHEEKEEEEEEEEEVAAQDKASDGGGKERLAGKKKRKQSDDEDANAKSLEEVAAVQESGGGEEEEKLTTGNKKRKRAKLSKKSPLIKKVVTKEKKKKKNPKQETKNASALDEFRCSLLHKACDRGDVKEVESLLFHVDIDVNGRDKWNRTPLHCSCSCPPGVDDALDVDLVRLLVDHGANVNVLDSGDWTPLQEVCRSEDRESAAQAARLLFERGAELKVEDAPFVGLHQASAKGNVALVRLLLEKGADVNAFHGIDADSNEQKMTPLHLVIGCDWYDDENADLLEMVKLLLDHGANVSAQVLCKDTPLHFAVKRGCTDVTKLLLDRGANPNVKNWKGNTPLHALFEGELGNEGSSVSSAALLQKQLEVLKLLLQHGADASLETNTKELPLHLAYRNVSLFQPEARAIQAHIISTLIREFPSAVEKLTTSQRERLMKLDETLCGNIQDIKSHSKEGKNPQLQCEDNAETIAASQTQGTASSPVAPSTKTIATMPEPKRVGEGFTVRSASSATTTSEEFVATTTVLEQTRGTASSPVAPSTTESVAITPEALKRTGVGFTMQDRPSIAGKNDSEESACDITKSHEKVLPGKNSSKEEEASTVDELGDNEKPAGAVVESLISDSSSRNVAGKDTLPTKRTLGSMIQDESSVDIDPEIASRSPPGLAAFYLFLGDFRSKIEQNLAQEYSYFGRLSKNEQHEFIAKEAASWWVKLPPGEQCRYSTRISIGEPAANELGSEQRITTRQIPPVATTAATARLDRNNKSETMSGSDACRRQFSTRDRYAKPKRNASLCRFRLPRRRSYHIISWVEP